MNDNPKKKSYKDTHGGKTRVGDWLRTIKGVASPVLDLVTKGRFSEAMSLVSGDSNNGGMNAEQANEFFRLIELDLKDMQGARDMYKSTDHEVADFVAKQVINYNLWVVFGAIIAEILCVIYMTDKVLIAIISGAVGGYTASLLQERQQVINFFFGSSRGSKKKQETLDSFNHNK